MHNLFVPLKLKSFLVALLLNSVFIFSFRARLFSSYPSPMKLHKFNIVTLTYHFVAVNNYRML